MAHEPLDLRPMTVADIIDGSIRLYRHNFGPLLGISAVVQVPVLLLGLLVQIPALSMSAFPTGSSMPDSQAIGLVAGLVVLLVAAMLLYPLGEAALAIGVSERYLGRPITISGAYSRAMKYWWRVLATTILFWLIAYAVLILGLILVGFVLMVIFAIRCMFAPAIIVALEGRGVTDSLKRSWGLSQGYGWQIFSAMTILYLMVSVATYGITAPFSIGMFLSAADPQKMMMWQVVYQIAVSVVSVILQPIWMIAMVLVYYDLRIRKEGFDLMMMAEALGYPTPEPVAKQEPLYANPDGPPYPPPAELAPPRDWSQPQEEPAAKQAPPMYTGEPPAQPQAEQPLYPSSAPATEDTDSDESQFDDDSDQE